jgi:hypothetical protein
MPGYLEQVGTFSGVGNKNSAKQIPGMRCDIFGES